MKIIFKKKRETERERERESLESAHGSVRTVKLISR